MPTYSDADLLENIAASINVLLCSFSSDGVFKYVNAYFTTLLGWPESELVGNSFYELVHPDDILETQQTIHKIFTTQAVSINFKHRYKTFQGAYIWLQWAIKPLNNGLVAANAVVVDGPTQLKQESYKHIPFFEHNNTMGLLGHWHMDLQANTLIWSKELYKLHGVTPDKFSPNFENIFQFCTVDDVDKINQQLTHAIKNEHGWDIVLRIARADGKIIWGRNRAKIYRDDKGKAIGAFGILQDITEIQTLNQQVELLSQVANTTTAGVVICDHKRNVIWANEAFEKLTDYSLNDVMGKNLGLFLQGLDTDRATVEEISESLRNQKNVNVEILNYNKQGKPYWNHLLISPVIKDGQLTHFIGLQHDITQRKEQAITIAQSHRAEIMGKLASGICHDFNNIMGVISGSIELLELKNSDDKLNRLINNIKHTSDRANLITKRLLKASSRNIIDKQIVDIDQELTTLVEMLSCSIPKNISLSHSLSAGRSACVCKEDLVNSLMNLVINAQYSIYHYGNVQICSSLHKQFNNHSMHSYVVPEYAAEYIKISVIDNGCGIPKTLYQKIFDPFFTTKGEESGTGLGLSLLINFVKEHKFGLTMQSQLGIGSEFTLWLPITAHQKSIKVNEQTKSDVLIDIHAVIIDDEPLLVEVIEQYLSNEGVLVVSFNEPKLAMEYIARQQEHINIVITDHYMPGEIQGSDIAKHITLNSLNIPCLILSGNINEPKLRNINNRVLEKPVSLKTLKQEILSLTAVTKTNH